MKAKDNPFRVERLHQLSYHPVDDTWPDILRRLAEHDHRGAILGPHGTGKSTLLDELAARLAASGLAPRRLFINDTAPAPPWRELHRVMRALGRRDVVMIDGAERLPRWTWARIKYASRRAGGLIITTHRRGMLPPVVTTRSTPGLLDALIGKLPEVRASELPMSTRALLDCCQGNVRDAMRVLYDHYATL